VARINYVELSVTDTQASKAFYEAAFGWSLTDFGPDYAATTTGDVDLGLQSDEPAVPLPVIEVSGLDDWPDRLVAAGATIVRPIFAFPGGRRFHFIDPAGNEIAVTEASH
jgi:predicted enzyme related to lactoylglutathione lyase